MKFPDEVRGKLLKLEWSNPRNFRDRLLNLRGPVSVPLHPPTGPAAFEQVDQFRRFLASWQQVEAQCPGCLRWETRDLRPFGQSRVPVRLVLESIVDLANFLGPEAVKQLHALRQLLMRFEEVDPALRSIAIRELRRIEKLSPGAVDMLIRAVPQLRPGIGRGGSLRMLQLEGVTPAFLTRQTSLIEALMDRLNNGEVTKQGGLGPWLGCAEPASNIIERIARMNSQNAPDRTPRWDVFISHATEDKAAIARPLADELRRQGLQVWYDEFALKVGDRLRRSIEKGLVHSRHGIVILSPSFFAKEWPQVELDALFAREVGGENVILPLWHEIDFSDVKQRVPTLAGRLAISTSVGLPALVEKLMSVIRDPNS